MTDISATFRTTSPGSYALKVLQEIVDQQTGQATSYKAWAGISFAKRGAADRAISAIMQILMDSQGNSTVTITAPEATAKASTGAGDDTITIEAGEVSGVGAGAGDDTISIHAAGLPVEEYGYHATVDRVYGGDGDDRISAESSGMIDRTNGGDGDDILKLSSESDVNRTRGGTGNDTIQVTAGAMAWATDGGAGDDTITIKADQVYGVEGGGGDDSITITANAISVVDGGKGDDHIVLHETGHTRTPVMLLSGEGDGNDLIETAGPLEIFRYSDDGTKSIDMSTARVTRNDDLLMITFAGSKDSIAVKLTGTMAEADDIALDFDANGGGGLLIRAADSDVTSCYFGSFERL